MPLEKQVCSLELAKKLKELGVEQDSLFWWDDHSELGMGEIVSFDEPDNPICSAFTVAELGEMLPREFDYLASTTEHSGYEGRRSVWLTIGRTIIDDGWYVLYSDPHPANKVPVYSTHSTTETDARAKMLIYLIENNLVTL